LTPRALRSSFICCLFSLNSLISSASSESFGSLRILSSPLVVKQITLPMASAPKHLAIYWVYNDEYILSATRLSAIRKQSMVLVLVSEQIFWRIKPIMYSSLRPWESLKPGVSNKLMALPCMKPVKHVTVLVSELPFLPTAASLFIFSSRLLMVELLPAPLEPMIAMFKGALLDSDY
jgi:hypothetical protein